MKKIQIFAMAALLAFGFASCVKNGETGSPQTSDGSAAYLSIKVDTKAGNTRGSGEDAGNEGTINSLYLVTFNDAGSIVGIPGGGYYISVTGTPTAPEPVKVSAAATNLVAIANPGTKLLAALTGLSATSSFASFNTAVSGITAADIVDATKGYAMITGGSETGKTTTAPNNTITTPYVSIAGKIQVITGTEADAIAAAKLPANLVPVKLERLASKVIFKVAATVTTPAGANFTFDKWTVDALNTTYFPFANKTLIAAPHLPATDPSYTYNFYTEDPNYADNSTYHSGLAYTTINTASDYAPVLPWSDYYGWKAAESTAYLVENTMAAAAQRFGNATRVVIKATYAPAGCTLGQDWFSWAGVNYPTFQALKDAYTAAAAGSPLKNACDAFFTELNTANTALGANNFSELTTTQLDNVPNGGELVKNGTNAVIRWYQKSLNYYYYEIRHNNEPLGTMAFGKYGVVRNNWYNLTLNSVSGAGTPWYPDLINPGPGDPDPKDPIDSAEGFLGITVSPQPWIIWETPVGI